MDIISHATIGATAAIILTGSKSPEIAIQGAVMGALPDLLSGPFSEGYHIIKSKFKIFSIKDFKEVFMVGTTHRWEHQPKWIINYYHFLHSIWFALLFTLFLVFFWPDRTWWGLIFYISHPFLDIFSHKDEKGKKFTRATRPFWPLNFSIQLFQWSDVYWWGKVPVIPVIIQVVFWCWFIFI